MQLNLHDGKNILVKTNDYNTGDTLKISLPSQKVLEHYPMKEGSITYIFGGRHAGETGNIVGTIPGTMTREPLVILKVGEKEFQTSKKYVFVIGTTSPVIRFEGETE